MHKHHRKGSKTVREQEQTLAVKVKEMDAVQNQLNLQTLL